MGAWGSGSFENDTALDWAAGVESVEDVRRPFEALKAATGGDEAGEMLDADLACELVAAAETVAMLMGRVSADFPEDLHARLKDAGEPDELLFHQARDALCHVMRNSELAELWAETADETAPNEWHVTMTGLVDRLNPDLEFTPWEPADIEEVVGKSVADCAFCDRPIPVKEHFAMSLYDFSDALSGSQTLSFHLPCLNARLHHKHAVLDFKFDPDKPANLDGL
jgi:hypothetical protein